MSSEAPQTKKFQKGERTITPASQKASKYYPAEDEAQAKKVRSNQTAWTDGERWRHWRNGNGKPCLMNSAH